MLRRTPFYIAGVTVLLVAAASPVVVGGESNATKKGLPPGAIFEESLQDVPGKHLVVVSLKWGPTTTSSRVDHRHPGSVYVYVTQGTVRLGVEGQAVREVHAGESFFESPGALHTIAESASATEPAAAIAVMIVPEGAPIITYEQKTK